MQVSGIASHRRVLPVSDGECSFFPYQMLMLLLLGVGGRELRGDGFFVLVKGGFASLLLCPSLLFSLRSGMNCPLAYGSLLVLVLLMLEIVLASLVL